MDCNLNNDAIYELLITKSRNNRLLLYNLPKRRDQSLREPEAKHKLGARHQ